MPRNIQPLEKRIEEVNLTLRTMAERLLLGLRTLESQFTRFSPELLFRLVLDDKELDRLEHSTQKNVLRLLATHKPLGYDLRFLHSAPRIASLLERMGDILKTMARQFLSILDFEEHSQEIKAMLCQVITMTELVFHEMFHSSSRNKLEDIYNLDDIVDDFDKSVSHKIHNTLEKREQSDNIPKILQIMNTSNRIEKFADLVCLWADEVLFIQTGRWSRPDSQRKEKVVFIDNAGGLFSTLAASYFLHHFGSYFRLTTLTVRKGDRFHFSGLFPAFKKLKFPFERFPVGKLKDAELKRTILAVKLGDFIISNEDRKKIPYKSIILEWPHSKEDEELLKHMDRIKYTSPTPENSLKELDNIFMDYDSRISHLRQMILDDFTGQG